MKKINICNMLFLLTFSLFLSLASTAFCIETDEKGFILKSEEPLKPAPAVLGLTLENTPLEASKILKKNGYNMKDPMLDAPYTVTNYNKRTEIFPEIELRVCNHPNVLVSMKLSGPSGDKLYDLVRERFSLKVGNVIKSELPVYYETYSKEFEKEVTVRLFKDGSYTRLIIESAAQQKVCEENQGEIEDVFKQMEEKKREKLEKEQRAKF